ncbi:AOC1 [Mytilus coruscus]|uniref:Amine oxidase n=1 Tax=Mytilus coruscus TaxID=42192 RepID=A0A6J8DW75_MYTCO|nr:AOC1 [Mytilus coruscus]
MVENVSTLFRSGHQETSFTFAEKATVTPNYNFVADLYLSPKQDVLNYLDNGFPQSEREARVMIFRGAITKPDVIELVVGPLSNPSGYRHVPYQPKSLPLIDRPYSNAADSIGKVLDFLDKKLGDMLFHLYGGRLVNCGDRCLISNFVHQKMFFSITTNISMPYKKVPFPDVTQNSRRIVTSRGVPLFKKPLRDPQQVSPDGKRYNINNRHISYGFWEFDVAIAPMLGPRLNDIRYKKERIAYEISSQELANMYSGYKPSEYTAFFQDNRYKTGALSKYLVPGVDCPSDATFISSSFKMESSDEPLFNAHAFCVFELNTGIPLRRHHAYRKFVHSFYEGAETIVMIVRTIPTILLYDYTMDFIFYQNGVIETKVTTFVMVATSWYQNRFETLDIEPVVTPNEVSDDPDASIVQNMFIKRLKYSELEEATKFDFNFPKYLTFVNNNAKDKFGNSAGYRLVNNGMTKYILPPNDGNNPAVSWSQYQVAVTKYKDSEPASSNLFAHSKKPVFTFQQFIDDNENIVDQDLVTWVAMGMHHIPQKEDIPVTHITGMSRSFFFLPYNYFDESPGMAVNNAVRIDSVEKDGKTESDKIRRYGSRNNVDCS